MIGWEIFVLGLADLSSLQAAVTSLDVEHLDAVVHHAGVALDDPPRKETSDGHELVFGTNHLGHFALTHWLTPLWDASPDLTGVAPDTHPRTAAGARVGHEQARPAGP